MIWKFGGKYNGKDVNSLPDDYLDWVINNAKNREMRETAQKIIEFRKNGKMSPAPKTSSKSDNALVRGLCLLIATNIDKDNPYSVLPEVIKYVVFNEIPMTPPPAIEDEPKTTAEEFNNPFLEGLE